MSWYIEEQTLPYCCSSRVLWLCWSFYISTKILELGCQFTHTHTHTHTHTLTLLGFLLQWHLTLCINLEVDICMVCLLIWNSNFIILPFKLCIYFISFISSNLIFCVFFWWSFCWKFYFHFWFEEFVNKRNHSLHTHKQFQFFID